MSRFANKVALVTGAASGIGAAVTQQLIDDGAAVVLFDLNAAAVESAATALGDKALAHAGDVTNEDDVKAAVDAAVAKFGKLDSAFNIAGLAKIGTITDGSVADWNATVDVVLGGTYLVTRYAALAMRAGGNGGTIVNVSSLNAHVPLYGGSSYAAAKAGVEAFTKNSALELGADGIRVNAVLPGLVETPMTAPFMSVESVANDFLGRIVAQRAGTPSEIADACTYLASDQASYVNGTSLVVDGGWEITNYPDLKPFT
jgi:NAD(P)-dependent dehydrogenase (short-subunit alcohol dehydrogenase family)